MSIGSRMEQHRSICLLSSPRNLSWWSISRLRRRSALRFRRRYFFGPTRLSNRAGYFRCWHLADVGISAHVRSAPEPDLPESRFLTDSSQVSITLSDHRDTFGGDGRRRCICEGCKRGLELVHNGNERSALYTLRISREMVPSAASSSTPLHRPSPACSRWAFCAW